jgi:hypothetical protein
MCPSIRHVECADNDYGEGSEGALLTLVHSWPLLECFCLARNETDTDTDARHRRSPSRDDAPLPPYVISGLVRSCCSD